MTSKPKIILCNVCERMITASHKTQHQDGLECESRGAAIARLAAGWARLSKGPGVQAAFEAAGLLCESDYNGVFSRGGPGRRARAPQCKYVAAWAAAVWSCLDGYTPRRKHAFFVELVTGSRAAAMQTHYALTKSIDPALFFCTFIE